MFFLAGFLEYLYNENKTDKSKNKGAKLEKLTGRLKTGNFKKAYLLFGEESYL